MRTRQVPRTALLFIVFALLFVVLPVAQGEEETEKCSACNGTGRIICRTHPEALAFKCSYTFEECPCHGMGWTPCTKCNDAKAAEEFAAGTAELESWIESRREKLDRNVFLQEADQHKCGHVEGEHIVVCGTIKPGTLEIGKKRIKADPKMRAHVYLQRSEECFEKYFLPMLGLNAYTPQLGKWEVTLWGTEEETLQASHRLVGNRQAPVATAEARAVTIYDNYDDKTLHGVVVHNLTHLMIEEYKGFVDGGIPDWFWEAMAHWVEYKVMGSVENNCNDEATPLDNALSGKELENRTLMLAKSKKCPEFVSFANLNVAKLGENERLMGWSIFDWLHDVYGPKKIELFVVISKRTKNQAQAFRDAFGLRYEEIQEEWKPWVLENYRKKR